MLGSDDLCDNDLHVAVRLNDIIATKEALSGGLNPDTIGLYEWNALHEAAYNGDEDILKLLLNHNADPNKQDLLNANTALHYAAAEGHSQCLNLLLEAGGAATTENRKHETCIHLASNALCRDVLAKHGYACKKEKPVKSILKTSSKSNVKEHPLSKPTISKHSESPVKSKLSKAILESNPRIHGNRRLSSSSSNTSGVFSPFSSTEVWDNSNDAFLRVPSSPARSMGSSYGSLTSLGSSGCSAADDTAGCFVMSFQYNSKKEEFKVRIWEIFLASLLPPSKMPKDTSMQLYAKTMILPDEQFQTNPSLCRNSEAFRLECGVKSADSSTNQCAITTAWSDKEAKISFKTSLSLDYSGITKQTVKSSAIKISLCIRPKRSFISSKSKSQLSDPTLASIELRMQDAVKQIMKYAYDTDRHEVLGITRPIYPLDGVLTDKRCYDNHSYNSDPVVHIRMTSLSKEKDFNKSLSMVNLASLHDGKCNDQSELSRVDGTSEEERDSGIDRSCNYSVSSLDSVISHASTPHPEVNIQLPPRKQSHRLTSVKVGRAEVASENNTKVTIPRSQHAVYEEKKHAGDKSRRRVGNKARNKLKSSGKLLLSTANSVIRPNVTAVTVLDDEERSMGSPSEEDTQRNQLSFEERLRNHQRSSSSGSLVEVDESPSRPRRRLKPSSQSPHLQNHPIHQERPSTRPSDWRITMDPEGTKIDITDLDRSQFSKQTGLPSSHGGKPHHDIQMKTWHRTRNLPQSDRTSSNHAEAKQKIYREKVIRRLIFDEDNDSSTIHDPCYVND